MSLTRAILFALVPFALAACEQLGLDDPAKAAAAREAEGRAIGSGCRHIGKSLEECYETNRRESKAAIFAGWREMDGYMRENQIPTINTDAAAPAPAAKAREDATDAGKKAPEAGGGAAEKPVAAPGKNSAVLPRRARLT